MKIYLNPLFTPPYTGEHINKLLTVDRLSELETGVANEQQDQPDVEQQASNKEEVDAERDDLRDEVESEMEPVQAREAQIEALTAELAQTKEQVLRAHADSQNARRRAEQEIEKAHKFGVEKLVRDLLPVVDNLERAISAIDTTNDVFKAVTEGIELTLKSFHDTLKRHNVEAIDPPGEPFDPQLHQAMSTVENADVEPNTIINVFQKGYCLNGRLVRPAMVVVSKIPASQDA